MAYTLIIICFSLPILVSLLTLYLHRVARKRGENYFPKYAKYTYLAIVLSIVIAATAMYITCKIAGIPFPYLS